MALQKQGKRIFISIVLVGSIIVAGTWLISDNGKDLPTKMPMHSDQSPPQTSLSETARLKPEPIPDAKPVPASSAAVPEVNSAIDFSYLRLIGVAIDPGRTYAVILNEKAGTQDLYHPGDMIANALLQDIFADKVILKYSDQLFTLPLESVVNEENGLTPEDLPGDESSSHSLSYMQQMDIEKAWQETQELMGQIELSQFELNNEPRGVLVDKVGKNSIFENIGLNKGDVILQVDDMEIAIADDAMEIYNCLRTKETVSFTVIRNGEKIILDYNAEN